MTGVILFNPNTEPVRTPRGVIGGGEWRFFETRHELTKYIERKSLIEVQPPEHGEPIAPGAVDAVLAYQAHQAVQAAQTVPESPADGQQDTSTGASKQKKTRVRDTDSASTTPITEGEG